MYEFGVFILSTPICSAIAIRKIFAIVPNPGFNRNGNQIAKTKNETNTVDSPILNGEFSETPSERTVHGALPSLDSTKSASPIPKRISPKQRKKNLEKSLGRSNIPQVDFAVHGKFGTNLAGFKNLKKD